MKQRVASLFLLLVLFGGAFAGVPLEFSESACSMTGLMDMECCTHALLQEDHAKFSDEELLCALNCAQDGSTLPASVVRVRPPAQTIQPQHLAVIQPLPQLSVSGTAAQTHSPPGSPPTYLRNLTLLI